MPYHLQPGEGAQAGLRRCAREQLDNAIEQLTDGIQEDPVAAIHDARKSLKKERSLLRLGRTALAPRDGRRENAAVREAGRRLSGARDADVMLQALEALDARYPGQIREPTLEEIQTYLRDRQARTREEMALSPITGQVVEELSSARRRVAGWRMRGDGWRALENGLLRSYRRGRKAMRRARSQPTVENLHEWRKRAKDHWYHLRLLRPISEPSLKGQADAAHKLADLLGDDHDLAVLRQTLLEISPEIRAEYVPVLSVIDHRREELQSDAFLAGERSYAERPKAFRERMRRYWKAWSAEQARDQERRGEELLAATQAPAAA